MTFSTQACLVWFRRHKFNLHFIFSLFLFHCLRFLSQLCRLSHLHKCLVYEFIRFSRRFSSIFFDKVNRMFTLNSLHTYSATFFVLIRKLFNETSLRTFLIRRRLLEFAYIFSGRVSTAPELLSWLYTDGATI